MAQEETYLLSIPMKDASTQNLRVTRAEVESWLTEHNKKQLICPDTQELIDRFEHSYQLDYNKTHPKPKGTRGGARANAGRKPKGITEKLHYSWRVSRDVWDILQTQANKTDFIERAIRAYARATGVKILKGEGG